MQGVVSDKRGSIPTYKKTDILRREWMTAYDFDRKGGCEKYVPIDYSTPSQKKYGKVQSTIRYVYKEDLKRFIW